MTWPDLAWQKDVLHPSWTDLQEPCSKERLCLLRRNPWHPKGKGSKGSKEHEERKKESKGKERKCKARIERHAYSHAHKKEMHSNLKKKKREKWIQWRREWAEQTHTQKCSRYIGSSDCLGWGREKRESRRHHSRDAHKKNGAFAFFSLFSSSQFSHIHLSPHYLTPNTHIYQVCIRYHVADDGSKLVVVSFCVASHTYHVCFALTCLQVLYGRVLSRACSFICACLPITTTHANTSPSGWTPSTSFDCSLCFPCLAPLWTPCWRQPCCALMAVPPWKIILSRALSTILSFQSFDSSRREVPCPALQPKSLDPGTEKERIFSVLPLLLFFLFLHTLLLHDTRSGVLLSWRGEERGPVISHGCNSYNGDWPPLFLSFLCVLSCCLRLPFFRCDVSLARLFFVLTPEW